MNPSSVQGPGRATGSARLLLDLVNGRLPVLVDTAISLVDIADCTEGHVLAAARGDPRRAVPAVGRDALDARSGRGAPADLGASAGACGSRPRRVAVAGATAIGAGARLVRRDPPVCREAVRTLLHGHRYDGSKAARELGLRYAPIEVTLLRTLEWFAERGLIPPARRRART